MAEHDHQGYPYDRPPQVVYYRVESHPKAVQAIIWAGVAWVACPVLPAIVALRLASTAEWEIEEARGRWGGEGLVTAAKALSWTHLALAGVMMLFFLAMGTAAGG